MNGLYSTRLYEAIQELPTSMVFEKGVPTTISAQKDVVYAYVKSLLDADNVPYEDILEEGQEAKVNILQDYSLST